VAGSCNWTRRLLRAVVVAVCSAAAVCSAEGVGPTTRPHRVQLVNVARPSRAVTSAARTLSAEAALARRRLAVTERQPHAGRAERPADTMATAGTSGSLAAAVPSRLSGPTGVLGVDVSGHQGSVNWRAVVGAGAEFVYVKATEGTYYVDRTYFSEQYSGSYDAGLVRGAYHFAIPDNSSGAAQADYFVAHGGGWSADSRTLPGMLDIEYNPYGAECYGLSRRQMARWVASFDNEYRRLTGRYPMLYTTAGWWDTCTGGSAIARVDPLDVSDWNPGAPALPDGWRSYVVWQYTDHDGLGFDGEAFAGSRTGLVSFARGGAILYHGRTDRISTATRLLPGHRIVAAGGHSEVVMQRDGNLVEYANGRALWSSHTPRHEGAWAVMQADGNLVVYRHSGRPRDVLWQTRTAGRGRSYAVVQRDGNFVVYTAARHRPTWSAGTAGRR